jgi:DNA-directed RNA polymerase I, II, and III subunit RPABC2
MSKNQKSVVSKIHGFGDEEGEDFEEETFPEGGGDDDEEDERPVRSSSKKASEDISVRRRTDSDDEEDEDDDESGDESSEQNGSDDDDDSEANPEEDEDGDNEPVKSTTGKAVNTSKYVFQMNREEDDDDDDDDEEEDDHYLQKFDEDIKRNVILEHHPELQAHNYDEVDVLTRVIRNEYGVIVDPMHRTMPFVSKYERARIIGERAKQINAGAKPFIEVDVSTLDGYVIALAEFKEKKIPFIVKRPLPNGGCEYWKLQDLEILD